MIETTKIVIYSAVLITFIEQIVIFVSFKRFIKDLTDLEPIIDYCFVIVIVVYKEESKIVIDFNLNPVIIVFQKTIVKVIEIFKLVIVYFI